MTLNESMISAVNDSTMLCLEQCMPQPCIDRCDTLANHILSLVYNY
jgi:hypothetical protein